jgi:hypothetical protein
MVVIHIGGVRHWQRVLVLAADAGNGIGSLVDLGIGVGVGLGQVSLCQSDSVLVIVNSSLKKKIEMRKKTYRCLITILFAIHILFVIMSHHVALRLKL